MRGFLSTLFAIGLAFFLAPAVSAQPARIILMRHAEKLNAYALCDMGTLRAQALVKQFLGRGATQSLFPDGAKPDAFLAITLHPLETITPAAQSWNMPVVVYSLVPADDEEKYDREAAENQRTQEAARDLLADPRYQGKTVVMTWEHNHIAKHKLEKEFPSEQVTLRQLLHLDQISGVPEKWPDSNYDFFWVIDYAEGNPTPTAFHMVRQTFAAPFDTLPANDWDEDEPRHRQAGCLK
jgi:hypothetical protein